MPAPHLGQRGPLKPHTPACSGPQQPPPWARSKQQARSQPQCMYFALHVVLGAWLGQVAQAGESGSIPIFSFDRGPVNCVPNPPNFTYIISSDVQLYFWSRDSRNVKDMALLTNSAQLSLWRNVTSLTWDDGSTNSTNMQAPTALVVNGDLTNFGLTEEWKQYAKMFHTKDMPWPLFPGLGNHDIMNNVNCWDWGVDSTTCLRNSITVLRQTLSGVRVKNAALKAFARLQGPLRGNIHERLNAFDWGSLAYSWDEGNYHFVMLNFNPPYTLDYGSYSVAGPVVVTPSYDFLDKELAKASATGRKVVLFIHDVDEHWVAANDTRFLTSIAGQPVVGIFCGHWHNEWGKVLTLDLPNNQTVPVFRSGSSEFQTSFIVEFGELGMRLQVVASSTEFQGRPGTVPMQFYQVNTSGLQCAVPEGAALPVPQCPPNWRRDGDQCRAPCPSGWRERKGRCHRTGCGPDEEQSGLLCYPPCAQGYSGAGPACWRHCPKGWTTLLFLCLINECPAGMKREGGMCYRDCKDGYHAVGSVCWQQCPSSYDDIGAFCQGHQRSFAKGSYSRPSVTALGMLLRSSYGRGGGLPIPASIDQDRYTLPSLPPLSAPPPPSTSVATEGVLVP